MLKFENVEVCVCIIEKHLELPDWYLLCILRITADCSVQWSFSSLHNQVEKISSGHIYPLSVLITLLPGWVGTIIFCSYKDSLQKKQLDYDKLPTQIKKQICPVGIYRVYEESQLITQTMFYLFTFLVCGKIKSPNLTAKNCVRFQ